MQVPDRFKSVLRALLQADPQSGQFVSVLHGGELRLTHRGNPVVDVSEQELAELERLQLVSRTGVRQGYVTEAGRSSLIEQAAPVDDALVSLEPELEHLLGVLVEASRSVPRERRRKFLIAEGGQTSVLHPGLRGGSMDVYEGDIDALGREDFLAFSVASRGSRTFDVTRQGLAHYEQMKLRAGKPVQQVESEVRQFLDGHEFQRRYRVAYERWREAADLLWSSDSHQELTKIGHLCREAIQEFAVALVEKFQPPNAPTDPAKDIARIDAVIEIRKRRLGEKEAEFLFALVNYWAKMSALAQRQTHGAQKEGEPLTWEDARRLVFQAAVVMFEVDRSLSRPG